MAGYDTGGGGGKAPSLTANNRFSLAKPYDLSGDATPESLSQIDEMMQQLYESHRLLYSLLEDGGIINSSGVASTGSGDVAGPASSVDGRIAEFDGTTGKVLVDSGKLTADVVTGPASATADRIATFNGTTGKIIQDGGQTITNITDGSLLSTTFSLTNAQILALGSSPIALVSAGGAGTMLVPIFLVLHSVFDGGGYNTGQAVTIRHSGGTPDLTDPANTVINTGAENVYWFLRMNSSSRNALTNTGLVIRSTGDVTGGHADNFLKGTLFYKTVTIA